MNKNATNTPNAQKPGKKSKGKGMGTADRALANRNPQAPPLHMYCQCIADPENSPACRVPDVYVQPTVAQKLTDEIVLQTNGDGDFCHAVGPALSINRQTYAIVNGSGATTDRKSVV